MFCTKCGNLLPSDSFFCDKCGNSMREYTEAPEMKDMPEAAEVFDKEIYAEEIPDDPDLVSEENTKGKKKRKVNKNRKKRPLLRLTIVLLVFFLIFNIAKAVIFAIDYKDYIFVNSDNCGMRDKDELIDKFIEAMLNGDCGECYRLSAYPLLTKEAYEAYLDDAEITSLDKIKLSRLITTNYFDINYYITEQLDAETFKTTYSFIESKSVDFDYLSDYFKDSVIDVDDIEKAEIYKIKITCKGNGGITEVINLTLRLVRISRTWYVYNTII